MADPQLSTGLPGLDRVLRGLIPGDNIVWQVGSVDDYRPFVRAWCEYARGHGRKLIYFRFGDHEPLVPDDAGAEVVRLDVSAGFEQFLGQIHEVIARSGRRSYLVFDCLSTLAVEWNSDRMLGNFFMLTCPYILDVQGMACFGLLRGRHSYHATAPIAETTQIFLDVHRRRERLYVHPIKVQHRYSRTMYMLHAWEQDEFRPVLDSSTTAEILTAVPWSGTDSVRVRLGVWNRRFLEAEAVWEAVAEGRRPKEEAAAALKPLLRMAITRDPRMLELAEKHLTLPEVLAIWRRMIGTGLIGGKAVGMLLARAILRHTDSRWEELLEAHDSFFIGSDVFYTFLVQNGCWWLRQKQRNPATFLEGIEEVRRRILTGQFPESTRREFAEMLDYFGQSPIIVRSSSLLEDSFGNAFAGKYESVFCANQGPHQKRLEDFMSAVRTIYASTMSEEALRYRVQRGLLERDEQMSLLVQRVSGNRYDNDYYPHVAGVGLSYNPYVWSNYIDPQAGMLRLVFGLGTRAVDRTDDDYTRIIALNAPQRRPEQGIDEIRQYSQRKVDLIDLEANQVVTEEFDDVARRSEGLPVGLFATCDRPFPEFEPSACSRQTLTFEQLLTETPFIEHLGAMLSTLERAYQYPVDTEFTANFAGPERFRINLVQCRPLQVAGNGGAVAPPPRVEPERVLLQATGAVIGRGRNLAIDRFVYVVPAAYGQLPLKDRYAVARLIGRVLHADNQPRTVMLLGPGRWGTTTPSLGVPVSFAEIDRVSVLCEIVAMRDDLVPDVSLGTHFFNELVELDILYLALMPQRTTDTWSREYFECRPSRLLDLVPDAAAWQHVVRVIDADEPVGLHANTLEQRVLAYLG